MSEIVNSVIQLVQGIGFENALILILMGCLVYVVKKSFNVSKKRIDLLISDVNKLKKDVNNCHEEKRYLQNTVKKLQAQNDKIEFRLEQSLTREKTLVEFFEHFKKDFRVK